MLTASIWFLNKRLNVLFERKEAKFAELRRLREQVNQAYTHKGTMLTKLIRAYHAFDKVAVQEAIREIHGLIEEDKLAIKDLRQKRDQAYEDYRKGDAQYYQQRINQLKSRINELYEKIDELKAADLAQIRAIGKEVWRDPELSEPLIQAKQRITLCHEDFQQARDEFHELKKLRDQKQLEFEEINDEFNQCKQEYDQAKVSSIDEAEMIIPVIPTTLPEPSEFKKPPQRKFSIIGFIRQRLHV